MNTTVTAEAVLVRNDKLHLAEKDGAHRFDYPRCAGRRISAPLVVGVAQAAIPSELGQERAAGMRALRREALANLSAQITPAVRDNLCEKCTKGL